MKSNVFRSVRNQKGSVLVLFVVMSFAFFGFLALIVDIGRLITVHREAQRAADSAALAGASAFVDVSRDSALVEAPIRALDYANRNWIRGVHINPADVVVDVDTIKERVTVSVRRVGNGTWFGQFLGVLRVTVSASAAAEAPPGSGATCLKPLMIPDLWSEADATQDANANRIWEIDELWDYIPATGDRYQQVNATNPNDPQATGYGSNWRYAVGSTPLPNDAGLLVRGKANSPAQALANGWFHPVRLPGSKGGNDYRNDILGCNPAVVSTGDSLDVEPGNMIGPTNQAFDDLLRLDPGIHWNGAALVGSNAPTWRDSPRVVVLAMMDPAEIANVVGASVPIVVNNFGLFFFEGFDFTCANCTPLNKAAIIFRFIGFAKATGVGGGTASLTKVLRLVE